MIRNILVAIVFFFGPALLMFAARGVFILLRLWLRNRLQQRTRQPEVIDITPADGRGRPPRWFYVVAVLLGLLSAGLALHFLSGGKSEEIHRVYVPAHVDEHGKVVPGHWQPQR